MDAKYSFECLLKCLLMWLLVADRNTSFVWCRRKVKYTCLLETLFKTCHIPYPLWCDYNIKLHLKFCALSVYVTLRFRKSFHGSYSGKRNIAVCERLSRTSPASVRKWYERQYGATTTRGNNQKSWIGFGMQFKTGKDYLRHACRRVASNSEKRTRHLRRSRLALARAARSAKAQQIPNPCLAFGAITPRFHAPVSAKTNNRFHVLCTLPWTLSPRKFVKRKKWQL